MWNCVEDYGTLWNTLEHGLEKSQEIRGILERPVTRGAYLSRGNYQPAPQFLPLNSDAAHFDFEGEIYLLKQISFRIWYFYLSWYPPHAVIHLSPANTPFPLTVITSRRGTDLFIFILSPLMNNFLIVFSNYIFSLFLN